MKTISIITRTLTTMLAAVCISSLATTSPSQAQTTPLDRRIVTVVGIGKASATPDIARVTLGVDVIKPQLNPALAEVNTKTANVIAAIKKVGIADKDIRTLEFSVFPQQSYGPTGPGPITGYRVTNSVRVTVRDLSKVGALLDSATNVGANTVSNLTFTLEDDATMQTDARTNAIKDAKTKAVALAKEAGVELGQVMMISEAATSSPFPILQNSAMAAAQNGGGGAEIAPGLQDISVQVQVTYELK